MKTFYLIFLVATTFLSCSTTNDAPMEQDDMQMDNDMMETIILSGDFVSVAHPTSGKATINDSKTVLNFEDFKTDDGPALEVYLATDNTASTYITLGTLKGVNGNYEYELPSGVDYTNYNHVIVWCVDFAVNFGYAILK